jgi:hypothetical protein
MCPPTGDMILRVDTIGTAHIRVLVDSLHDLTGVVLVIELCVLPHDCLEDFFFEVRLKPYAVTTTESVCELQPTWETQVGK